MKFKIGDEVIIVKSDISEKAVGKIGTIIEVSWEEASVYYPGASSCYIIYCDTEREEVCTDIEIRHITKLDKAIK